MLINTRENVPQILTANLTQMIQRGKRSTASGHALYTVVIGVTGH